MIQKFIIFICSFSVKVVCRFIRRREVRNLHKSTRFKTISSSDKGVNGTVVDPTCKFLFETALLVPLKLLREDEKTLYSWN